MIEWMEIRVSEIKDWWVGGWRDGYNDGAINACVVELNYGYMYYRCIKAHWLMRWSIKGRINEFMDSIMGG